MDQKNAGPTVFDINRPQTYGAAPSARPVIVGHRPTMPDPMITPLETPPSSSPKIKVKVDEFSGPLANVGDEPQRSSYMQASDLTGATQNQPSSAPEPNFFGNVSQGSVSQDNARKHHKSRVKLWLLPLLVLILLAGAYAAIDKGLILSSINLPVHIFKKTDTTGASSQASGSGAQTSVPSGFTSTKLVEANLTLAYPTIWGAPTASTDLGFSKRSASAKAEANYAFVVGFPDNKDVQLAITSAKFLPPARATQYYDFLGWCVGTADAKYYAGVVRFTTAAGVDTPTTVTCDQGPLNNVAKLTSDTIVQTNIKNTDGSVLGDIYTKNLSGSEYAVVRAKDATAKNSDLIITMLGTIQNTQ